MTNRITVIGASLGGLVAAAELNQRGHSVTIVEKGNSVGGLYNKIKTPFGVQELGMHVLYVDDKQYKHLSDIFGPEVFNIMTGSETDIGASANFDTISFGSLYPNAMNHPKADIIYSEVLEASKSEVESANAHEEALKRFGAVGEQEIVSPILQKLWKKDPSTLTPHALHCFYDLRRMVICDKSQADILKDNPRLDETVANPNQLHPKGEVFGGRMGLTFKTQYSDLADRVAAWASRVGVVIEFNQQVAVEDDCLSVGGVPVHESCDGCLIAVPMQGLANSIIDQTDQLELSIYYVQLSEKLKEQFPAYYILCHDAQFKSSRVVNYDGYNRENKEDRPSVIAVEAIHTIGNAPREIEITQEINSLFPELEVQETFKLDQSVKVCSPTLNNNKLLSDLTSRIESHFGSKPVYFTGMRTDTGIFFSHHTIGLAYESALECSKRLL